MTTVALIDYGAGNLVSIRQAFESLGVTVKLVRTGPGAGDGDDVLRDADALVVPGVGAAGPAMARLKRRRLVEPIVAWVRAGRPYLGICLGLQLLFEGSDEDGSTNLGLLPGRTVLLQHAPTLPHMGWNQVVPDRDHPALAGLPDGTDFYFVHSYVAQPSDPAVVVATTSHGSTFASVVASGALLGVQFHPERSGADGLRLLRNFVAMVDGGAPRRATGAGARAHGASVAGASVAVAR